MITLTYNATPITLGNDLVWTDRHSWSEVVETEQRTTTGSLIVEAWQRTAGRPITLQSEPDYGLVLRSTVTALEAWQDLPGIEMTLDFHGEIYTVMFNHSSGAAVSATPAHSIGAPAVGDYMNLTLKLRTA